MNKKAHLTRIAYVIGQLSMGGTESQLLELVRHLNHDHFEILVVCLSGPAPLAKAFTEAGCEVRVLDRETRSRPVVFLDLYRLLSRFKPEIVHAYAYASRAAIPIAKFFLPKCKSIVSISV